jgi:hypothetical protein
MIYTVIWVIFMPSCGDTVVMVAHSQSVILNVGKVREKEKKTYTQKGLSCIHISGPFHRNSHSYPIVVFVPALVVVPLLLPLLLLSSMMH